MRLLSVLLMLLATTTFAQNVISLSNPMAAPSIINGATNTVSVDLSGPGGNTAGINFAVKYDPVVLSNPQMSLGDLTPGLTIKSDCNVLKDAGLEKGEFRGIIYYDPVQSFTDAPGVIAKISFNVAASATPCIPSTLKLLKSSGEQFGISNTVGVSITDNPPGNYTTQDGSVRVTYPGDFDNNGSVNIFDFNKLVVGWGTTYNIYDFNGLVVNWQQSCSY